jgi:hypothetical protein
VISIVLKRNSLLFHDQDWQKESAVDDLISKKQLHSAAAAAAATNQRFQQQQQLVLIKTPKL